MAEKAIRYNTAKPWQVIFYPLASGVGNLFLITMMYSSYVAAGGYGIAVATAGLVATYSRIFDAVTDPIIGFLTTRMPSKWGKCRVLLLSGFAIMALSCIAMFFWCVGTNLAVFTLCYMCYIIGYTIYGVGNQTAVAVLTNEPHQRPKLSRYGSIYTSVLSALQSLYLSNYLSPKWDGLKMGALQEICLATCIVGGLLLILVITAIWDKDRPEAFMNASSTPVKMRDVWNTLKNNRQLQMLIVAGASDKLAQQTSNNSFITTMVFGIIIGNFAFSGQLKMINLLVQIPLVFIVTGLAGKYGTRKANIGCTIASIIISLVTVAYLALIDPTQITVAWLPTVIFVILYSLIAAVKMATGATTSAMIPDCTDYEMYRTGRFMPGVVGAAYSFMDKMVSSVASTIAALGVSLVGYVNTTPQPGDPSTPAIFWMAMFLWLGMPILGWICTLVAMKWYNLDKEKMQEIQEHNAELRAAAQANK